MEDLSEAKAISAISLFEIKHLHERGRVVVSPQQAIDALTHVSGFIIPVGPSLLEFLPPQMELHDGIIVATGLFLKGSNQTVRLVTKDRDITESGLLPVIW